MKQKVMVVLGMVLVSSVALADGKKGIFGNEKLRKKSEIKEKKEGPFYLSPAFVSGLVDLENRWRQSMLDRGVAMLSLAADQVLDQKQMSIELKRIKDRLQALRNERSSIKGKNETRVVQIDAEIESLSIRKEALRLAFDADVTVGEFAARVGTPSKKEYAAVVTAQVEKLINTARVRDALAKLSPVSKHGELAETQAQATPQDPTAAVSSSIPCGTCPYGAGGVTGVIANSAQ